MGSPDAITGSGLVDFKTTSTPKPIKHPGEDIRVAKAIFEHRFGPQNWNDVNLWLEFANEVKDYLGLSTIQDAAEFLEIKYRKPWQ